MTSLKQKIPPIISAAICLKYFGIITFSNFPFIHKKTQKPGINKIPVTSGYHIFFNFTPANFPDDFIGGGVNI